MAYPVTKGKVTGDSPLPDPNIEEEPQSSHLPVVIPSESEANNVIRRIMDKPLPREEAISELQQIGTRIARELQKESATVVAKPKLVQANSMNLQLSSVVARKVKPDVFGTVHNIQYQFGAAEKTVSRVWVKFPNKAESLPYMPIDLYIVYLN